MPADADVSTLAAPGARVLSVSALTRQARLLIEEHFGLIWVEGELSNLRVPASGHWYFTLKDADAQLRCAMFAGRNRAVRERPREGQRIVVRGRLSLYEPRGDFQLIAEHLEAAGEGALRAAFDALKARLADEGLFDSDRKRPLPAFPRHVAIVSSASGAALHDVLHVIARRFPGLAVTLLPVRVQGAEAEADLVAALARVGELVPAADAVLITRGGGSLEDLWAFNLEPVVRAVAACPIATISAVGHQTDVTLVDFAADLRAPTPSAGAELLTPDRRTLARQYATLAQRLQQAQQRQLARLERDTAALRRRLVDPRRQLQARMQRADELDERLRRAVQRRRQRAMAELAAAARALGLLHPRGRTRAARERLQQLAARLDGQLEATLQSRHQALRQSARTLQAVSPLATLDRGYAVLTREAGSAGRAITQVEQVTAGEALFAQLADGALAVQVTAVHAGSPLPRLPDFSDEDH